MATLPQYSSLTVTPSASGAAKTTGSGSQSFIGQEMIPNDAVGREDAGATATSIGKGMTDAGTLLSKVAYENRKKEYQAAIDQKNAALVRWELDWQRSEGAKKGADAMGLTDSFLAGYHKEAQRLAKELPEARRDEWLTDHMERSFRAASTVATYEQGQKDAMDKEALSSYRGGLKQKLELMPPGYDFEKSLEEYRNTIKRQLELDGIRDSKVVDQYLKDGVSKIYEQRVRNLLKKDPVEARGYAQGVMSFITDSGVRAELERDVADASEKADVSTYITENFDSLSKEDVVKKYVDARPEVQQFALSRWEWMHNARETDRQDTLRETRDRTLDAFEAVNGDLSQLNQNDLRYLEKNDSATYNYLVDTAAGRNRKTDPSIHTNLMEAYYASPKEFAALDLKPYIGSLSNDDYQAMRKLQEGADKQTETMTRAQQLKQYFNEFGLNGKDNDEDRGAFLRVFSNIEAEWEVANGKPPNQEERRKILDMMVIEGDWDSDADGSGSMFSSDTRWWKAYDKQELEGWTPFITDEDRTRIINIIKQQKNPDGTPMIATDEKILSTYKLLMGLPQ